MNNTMHKVSFRPARILIPALLMMLFCAPPARAQLSRIRFHSYKITSVVPSTVNSIRGSVEFVLSTASAMTPTSAGVK